jgi:predicted alpha/beta superfamily hydrolase
VKPRIDRGFRTRRPARDTAIAGSSMGGLISLYAWFRRPDVFGHAAALSPSLWFGRERLFDFLAAATPPRGRLYLDVGTEEGAQTLRDARMLKRLLDDTRMSERLGYREWSGDRHEEAAWSRRIGGAIEFLIGEADR